jgi:hypothetical protein
MAEIFDAFGTENVLLILVTGVVYLLVSLFPFLWPAWVARRRSLPNARSFVLLVGVLVYGAMTAIDVIVLLPVTAYEAFIAPQLSGMGYGNGWTGRVLRFVVDDWWLWTIPLMVVVTLLTARVLARRWKAVATAFAGAGAVE